jgi:hypothetical protein
LNVSTRALPVGFPGLLKKSICVSRPKSRSAELDTKAVMAKRPRRLMKVSVLTVTIGGIAVHGAGYIAEFDAGAGGGEEQGRDEKSNRRHINRMCSA